MVRLTVATLTVKVKLWPKVSVTVMVLRPAVLFGVTVRL